MKTVSLDPAKQLKEAEYPQDTVHFHVIDEDDNSELMTNSFQFTRGLWKTHGYEYFASPTADEILDLLPLFMDTGDIGGRGRLVVEKGVSGWTVGYINDGGRFNRDGETIADAAALMWLYLKGEGLI